MEESGETAKNDYGQALRVLPPLPEPKWSAMRGQAFVGCTFVLMTGGEPNRGTLEYGKAGRGRTK